MDYFGTTYYEYTCCPVQSNSTGDACGDYTALESEVGVLVAIITYSVVGGCLCLGLCGTAIFFCCALSSQPKPPRAQDLNRTVQHNSISAFQNNTVNSSVHSSSIVVSDMSGKQHVTEQHTHTAAPPSYSN